MKRRTGEKPATINPQPATYAMPRLVIILLTLLLAALINQSLSRPESNRPRQTLAEFPRELGDWKSVADHTIDSDSMAVLLVDDYIMRTYTNARGESIGLYIGYFTSQREGKQVHSPRQCLPGAGWSLAEQKEYFLDLPANSSITRLPMNFFLMQHGEEKQLYLWWFQGRGRAYTNEYLNKFYLIWDGLTKNRTDGALVRINMSVGRDSNAVLESEKDFILKLIPELGRYIPE